MPCSFKVSFRCRARALQSKGKREEFEREVGAGLEEVKWSNASMTSEGKWKGLQDSYYQLLVRSWVVGKEDMWIALQGPIKK